jgi:hypothetical protein
MSFPLENERHLLCIQDGGGVQKEIIVGRWRFEIVFYPFNEGFRALRLFLEVNKFGSDNMCGEV